LPPELSPVSDGEEDRQSRQHDADAALLWGFLAGLHTLDETVRPNEEEIDRAENLSKIPFEERTDSEQAELSQLLKRFNQISTGRNLSHKQIEQLLLW